MRRVPPLLVAVFIVGLILPFFTSISEAEYTTPIVWSNKKNYDPSEIAYLFGYGFKPSSPVTITIVRPDFVEDFVETFTDEFGYFASQYQLDGIHGTFNVTATDGVNIAITDFDNSLYLNAWWKSQDSTHLYAEAGGLSSSKQYYVKYFDPAGVERRKSPTYSGVTYFKDNLTILPSFPNVLGYWTVKLYENNVLKRTKTVYIGKIVWTTDSTYTVLITSFARGETVYFKTIGLQTSKYYRFMLERPDGTKIYVGSWTTGVTSMTGSYVLSLDAPIGTWKLHVRQAYDQYGGCEDHYVDCLFEVTTAPPPVQYYLTVRTTPPGIGTIPGQGWYNACTTVNLTAPETFPGLTGVRYRFDYWDVDGVPNATGVREISVYMNANHTATAHYITQYFLNLTTNPPGVTTPAGVGWYDAGTTASIFAPEFISIIPGASRYHFNGWTTANMSEIANPSAPSTTVYMDEPKTVTANYVTQYYLTVSSPYGTTGGQGWYDSGSTVYATLDTGVVDHGNGTRRVFVSWGGDASGSNYAQSNPIIMNAPKTATANWKTEYKLTVRTNGLGTYTTNVYNGTTLLGTATDATPYVGWVAEGSSILLDVDSPITDGSKRFMFTQWSGDASGSGRPFSFTMNTTKDITANYKTQYKITVTASPSGALGGTFKVTYTSCGTLYTNVEKTTTWTEWVDADTTVTVSEPQDPINGGSGTRYSFDHYDPSNSVLMNQAKTITLIYNLQYYLTVSSPYGTAGGSGWYNNGEIAYATLDVGLVNHGNGTRRVFVKWSGDASGTNYVQSDPIVMNGPKTATAEWMTQYQLTVRTNGLGTKTTNVYNGTNILGTATDATPFTGWFDQSSSIQLDIDSPIYGSPTKYEFTQWTGDASGSNRPVSVSIDSVKDITANYKVQHEVTFTHTGLDSTASGTVVIVNGNPKSYGDLPYKIWVDNGTVVTYSYSDVPSSTTGKRFILVSVTGPTSPITVIGPVTVTGNYMVQYYLTVSSPYGTTGGQGWYDSGSTAYATLNTGLVDQGNKTRRVFTSWGGDASGSNYAQSNPIIMNAPKTATANWKTQYLLTVLTDPTGLSPQPTRNPTGEAGPANSWWYDVSTDVTLTAQTVTGYDFSYWDVDGVSKGAGVNPISVSMNAPHTATAHYTTVVPPLAVAISPLSETIFVGESVIFTSTVTGGTPPYTYQWYLNDNPVGTNSPSWTFISSTTGTFYVYLKVTDNKGNIAQSEIARIIVMAKPPVGGYTISIPKTTPSTNMTAYAMVIVLLGLVVGFTRRKRK